MEIKFNIANSTMYIMLMGELDEYCSGYTRDYLDNLFDSNIYSSVVYDLSKLEFMDSTGIGVFIGRYKKLRNKNKDVYIANPSNAIEKIFKMSGIYEIMPKIS